MRPKRSKRRWTKREIKIVKELYPTKTLRVVEIAGRLNRTRESISSYAKHHRLRRGEQIPEVRCLSCLELFHPGYHFNRICPPCQNSPAWQNLATRY